jgi:glycopeptide antibiotics resistance protein
MDSQPPRTPNASGYLWLACGLLLLTVYGSLIPFRFEPMPLDEAVARFRDIRHYALNATEARGDWVVNMVQYAAVAFCFMGALAVDRRPRGLLAAAVVVPAGCGVALAMEFLQVYFPPRTVSVNDILVESLGTALGAAAWLLAGQRCTEWWRRFWGGQGVPALAAQALPAYLAVLLVVYLMPFDLVLGRAELAEKFQRGRIQLVPFAHLASGGLEALGKSLVNVAAFVPVGVLLGLIPRWSRRRGTAVLAVGLALTASVEGLKLLVYTRYCDMTDVFMGTAAVLLGWWLARGLYEPWAAGRRGAGAACVAVVRRWGPVPWALLALAWAVVLVLANWRPFDFTTDPARFLDADAELSDEDTAVVVLRRMSWAPFVDYYWGSRYQALDQILWRSLSFAPLGILLAQALRPRRGGVAAVLSAGALAAVIEAGQYFIPQRHPSVTDLLVETFGAWLGYRVARHAAGVLAPDLPGRGAGQAAARSRAAKAPAPDPGPPPPPVASRAGRATALADWLAAQPFSVGVAYLGAAGLVLILLIVLALRMFAP